MRVVPERSSLLTFGVTVAAFLSGPFLGLQLGVLLASDSDVAQTFSIMSFPLAFAGGISAWMGIGIVKVVCAAVRSLMQGGPPRATAIERDQTLVPPGYGAFVVIAPMTTGLAGLIVAMTSGASVIVALPVYAMGGAAYGGTLWWLAHHGYLPFPEPE